VTNTTLISPVVAPVDPAIVQNRPEPFCGLDPWLPLPARVLDVVHENFNTRTFKIQIVDPDLRAMYRFLPGQFNMLYAPGVGEAAISISSDSESTDVLEHTIRLVGSVTRAIDRIGKGGVIGLRGPFGRPWPVDKLDGHDLVMVAGGIGLAPLRPVVHWALRNRSKLRRVMLLFGCRTPSDRLFVEQLDRWTSDRVIDVLVTVDNATAEWTGPVGVVTKLLQRVKVNADRTLVMVCGPRILNRVAAWNLLQLHVPPSQVYVSLERNMNCGFGRCGHCQYGSKFVCKDGPVFCFSEVDSIFGTEEI
jgi:NAD(P)H-flavin reductase